MTFQAFRQPALAAVFLFSAFTLLPASNTWADTPVNLEPAAITGDETRWGLGVGVAVERKPYKGADNKTQLLPLVFFENRYVRVFGPGVDVKLPSAGPVEFALRAEYGGNDYKASDATGLAGMNDRKASVWLGGKALWRNPVADLRAEALFDASGKSSGQRLSLTAEKHLRLGEFVFMPRLSVQRLDQKYVNYYYGVTAAEATAARPAYSGKATTNVELGLRTVYPLAPQQSLMLDISTTQLGSGIKNSPLLDKSSTPSARVAYVYRF